MLERLCGRSIVLRLVRPDDAETIVELRTDPGRRQFISPTASDIGQQRQWIERYLEREAAGQELYYMICRPDGEAAGTVRLYDFRGESFCWGSWVMKPTAPPTFAIESAFAVLDAGFGPLGFARAQMQTRLENRSVASFLRRLGSREVARDEIQFHFELTRDDYLVARVRHAKFLDPLPTGDAAPPDGRPAR